MKRIIKAMLCTLLAFACFMPQVMAAPVPVKVRGTAAAGDTAHAQQDAQKKAVYRVLSTLLDNSNKDNEVVNKIMSHYQEYTGKVAVNKKVTEANKLYLNATVMVDADKLRDAVHDGVAKEQKAHRDDVSAFLIRVVDENGKVVPEDNIMVQKVYDTTFKNRGFSTDTADDFNAWVLGHNEPYADFVQQTAAKAQTDYMSVTMAVIGEVRIIKCQETAEAFNVEAKVQLKALDMCKEGKVVANFAEDCTLAVVKDAGRKQAINQLLYKAAMNSSGYLAEQTLAYWHK